MNQDDHSAAPDSKGKGKEPIPSSLPPDDGQDQRDNQQGHSSSENGSFTSRLATSAASLSRNMLTSRWTTLPSESTEKPQWPAIAAQNLAHQEHTATYHDENTVGSGSRPTSLQSRHSSSVAEHQFVDFMDAQAGPDDVSRPRQPKALISSQLSVKSAVSEQEARDGQQVMDLLDTPSELHMFDDNDSCEESSVSPYTKSSLRKALFGASEGTSSSWTMLLDFQPNLLMGDNLAEIQHHFGDVDPEQAKELWMDSWRDVFTSYTDEVWGDLGSLVREAQKEVERAREHGQGQGRTDMKALQRLRQILAHVRGPHG
ncbi:hypothetical protein GQ607_014047 [Colletotrichum asianum]|uniref:Uncharacterized protein n=1 Tax=Colletotrichum asianum TaxID=702518 RepID=A0A8H3ZP74_9PEZI|nr:hypothetical protein GQ607_014047 [Colletotrichum asianum]